jgi:hypothetical protein
MVFLYKLTNESFMKMMTTISLAICFILTFSSSFSFAGEEDLFGESDSSDNYSLNKTKLSFTGAIDARFINTGEDQSWRDEGGIGISRYGSHTASREHSEIIFSQANITALFSLNDKLSALVQFAYNDHEDRDSNNPGKIGIIEAYMVNEFKFQDLSMKMRIGIFVPPASLEHENVNWLSVYTITPSALYSWVGEELRAQTLELSFIYKDWNLTAAAYSGNDPAGAILSWRGWSMSDLVPTIGSRLKIDQNTPSELNTAKWTSPHREIDGRLGTYGKIRYRWNTGDVSFFYYDNLANNTIVKGGDYAWRTKFGSLSIRQSFFKNFEFLAQYMSGSTKMNDSVSAVDNDIDTWYALASYKKEKYQFGLRYDWFKVHDNDSFRSQLNEEDLNDSKGLSITASAMYTMLGHYVVGPEYVYIKSQRVANTLNRDPDDNLFQFLVRYTF